MVLAFCEGIPRAAAGSVTRVRHCQLGMVLFGGGIATACSTGDVDAIGANGQPVIGGRTDDSFRAAGYLVREGIASCSAVLIEPDLVLTAAHCVDGHHDIQFGWGAIGEQEPVRSIARAVHPRYMMPRKNGGVAFQGFDVALLRLERSPDVEPAALGDARRFEKVRAIGYGATSYETDESGTREPRGVGTERRSIEGTVLSENETELFVRFDPGMAACYGDSGGPLFSEESGEVVAVLSRFTELGRCLPKDRSLMGYVRVEAMSSFFREARTCMHEEDVQRCLREDERSLCEAPRFENRSVSRVVDATPGSTTFELVDGERLSVPVKVEGDVALKLDASGDALLRVTRGERGEGASSIAERATSADLEPGRYDLVIGSCNGKKQSVTLRWGPRRGSGAESGTISRTRSRATAQGAFHGIGRP